MSLANLSNEILLQNILDLVKKEREITLEILHFLQEVEDRYLFAELGFSSLFKYAVTSLGYSEGAAQRRISSMRLLRSMPEIESKVESGALSLSVLSQAHTFFRQERIKDVGIKKEILTEIEGKSSREAERELMAHSANPEKALLRAKESLRALSPNYSQLSIVIDDKLLAELQELKDLLAARNPYMSLKEVIEFSVGHSLESLRVKPPKEAATAKSKASQIKKDSLPAESNDKTKPLVVKVSEFNSKPNLPTANFKILDVPPTSAIDSSPQLSSPMANFIAAPSTDSWKRSSPTSKPNSTPPTSAVNSDAIPTASAMNPEVVPFAAEANILPPTSAVTPDAVRPAADADPVLSAQAVHPDNASPTEDANPIPPGPPADVSSPPPTSTNSKSPSSTPASRYISIQIKRQVWVRDQNQCTYVHAETGRRCSSTFQLQIDHIHPHAKGGGNSLDNLRLLCRAHNAHAAIQNFGTQKMDAFRVG